MPSFRRLLALFLITATGCTAGTTSTGIPGETQPGPAKAIPSGTPTSEPAPTEEEPTTEPQPDPEPTLDKTKRFTLTLEGQPVTVANVTTKVEGVRVVIAGSYEQDLNGPLTSTATFTIRVDGSEKGKDSCGTGGRAADYWFKDTDGALRGLGTSYQGGSCTMTVIGNAADGFSSGSATGTLGGVKTKSFTLNWGQPIPKS